MKMRLALLTIALLSGCNRPSDSSNTATQVEGENRSQETTEPFAATNALAGGFDARADIGSYNRTVELAKDALALGNLSGASGVKQETPGMSEGERSFTARALASTLPPIGSGNGPERVVQHEVNLDPPQDAKWIARSRVVYAGARPIDVYLFDDPVVPANAVPEDAASMLAWKSNRLIDMPIGELARTSSTGKGPAAWCIAFPIKVSHEGICTMTANSTKRLLLTTYIRRDDSEPVANREALGRLFDALRAMYAKR